MSTLADNIIRDVIASRPTAGIEGRLFFASDTGNNYYDDGSAWQSISGGGLSVTTKGDLQGFSTVPARIPVGTDGTVLGADSTSTTGVSWQSVSGGGGVVGTAKFDPSSGSISGLVTAGVISGVTRTNTGLYAVTFSPNQSDYIVNGVVEQDPGTFVGYVFVSTGTYSSSGFTLGTFATNAGGGGAFHDFSLVTISVIKL